MSITGKVLEIGTTETFGAKGFRKRNLIIETNEKYTQELCIEFVQDNVSLLDSYKLKDNVEVEYNIRGRKWESPNGEIKYYCGQEKPFIQGISVFFYVNVRVFYDLIE